MWTSGLDNVLSQANILTLCVPARHSIDAWNWHYIHWLLLLMKLMYKHAHSPFLLAATTRISHFSLISILPKYQNTKIMRTNRLVSCWTGIWSIYTLPLHIGIREFITVFVYISFFMFTFIINTHTHTQTHTHTHTSSNV